MSTVLWPPRPGWGGRGRGPGGGRGSGARAGRGRRRRRRRRHRGVAGVAGVALAPVVGAVVAAAAVVGPVGPVDRGRRSGRTGPCAGRGRPSGPCAGRGRRGCARFPAAVLPGAVLPAAVAPAALAGALRGGLGSDIDGRSGHGCTVLALVGAVDPLAARTALARASGGGLTVGLDGGGGVGRLRGSGDLGESARRPAWCRRAAQARRPARPRRAAAEAAGSAAGRRIGFRALARRAGGPRGDATAPGRRRCLRSGLGRAAVAVRAGHRGLGQRELRSRSARLALLDGGDEVALAHLRGVRDVQFTRKLAQLGEHHRAQALAAGGGGSTARGVRRARLGRGTGGDEIGLAHEGPS